MSVTVVLLSAFSNWYIHPSNIEKFISLIVGFHMTSLKFKLKNYRSYRDFTFHDALQLLKTNFHTNFHFKRGLGFVIEYA